MEWQGEGISSKFDLPILESRNISFAMEKVYQIRFRPLQDASIL